MEDYLKSFGTFDDNLIAMELGKGLYWSMRNTLQWKKMDMKKRAFANECVEYYCENITVSRPFDEKTQFIMFFF